MNATARLHHADSWLLSFDATVAAHGAFLGKPSVVLDATAFYAEAGGQGADTGMLGGARVVDVQVDDGGVVHHFVDGEAPAVGARVHGEVDRARRRQNMALHTGQHMLSRALLDVAHGETVSSRLGESGCTIDLGLERISDEELKRAEDAGNAAIDDDRPIRAFFPSPSELAALPLRRAPKVTENVRVIDVEGFDVSPCGGTHCTRTGQVGLVRIVGWERYKGMARVMFDAGKRARDALLAEGASLRGMARGLTCGPAEVAPAVDRLRAELDAARTSLGLARQRLAAGEADALAATGKDVVVGLLDDGDVDHLRAIVKRLCARPQAAAFLGVRAGDGILVVASRGGASAFDCGAALKRVASECGGRGGGRPNHAEGRLPSTADWAAVTSWMA